MIWIVVAATAADVRAILRLSVGPVARTRITVSALEATLTNKVVLAYTCMDCGKTDTDSSLFKMVETGKIAFVVCSDCLRDW